MGLNLSLLGAIFASYLPQRKPAMHNIHAGIRAVPPKPLLRQRKKNFIPAGKSQ